MFRFASVLRRTRSVQMSRRSRPHVAHRLEPLESRRLLSDTPLRPDLVATSDTGVSDTDNITRSDNASPERALQFLVGNTTPGANVVLFIDGQFAGSATAFGPTSPAPRNSAPTSRPPAATSFSFSVASSPAAAPRSGPARW